MKTIFKYVLPAHDSMHQIMLMPKGAEILSCQEHYGNIAIWALVDTEVAKVERHFEICETGVTPMLEPRQFLGTVQFSRGTYILHVFVQPEEIPLTTRQLLGEQPI